MVRGHRRQDEPPRTGFSRLTEALIFVPDSLVFEDLGKRLRWNRPQDTMKKIRRTIFASPGRNDNQLLALSGIAEGNGPSNPQALPLGRRNLVSNPFANHFSLELGK